MSGVSQVQLPTDSSVYSVKNRPITEPEYELAVKFTRPLRTSSIVTGLLAVVFGILCAIFQTIEFFVITSVFFLIGLIITIVTIKQHLGFRNVSVTEVSGVLINNGAYGPQGNKWTVGLVSFFSNNDITIISQQGRHVTFACIPRLKVGLALNGVLFANGIRISAQPSLSQHIPVEIPPSPEVQPVIVSPPPVNPVNIQCPHCNTTLQVKGKGTFPCPKCGSVLKLLCCFTILTILRSTPPSHTREAH